MTKNQRRVIGAPAQAANINRRESPPVHNIHENHSMQRTNGADHARESSDTVTIYCPICNQQMHSLRHLNRHLDEEHVEISEAVHEVGVRSWLQKQIAKSSKLAPVSVLSRTLGLTEDFVRNGTTDTIGLDATKETDEVVSHKHWQNDSAVTHCAIQPCASTLKSKNINCRHCGRIFCDLHTRYQMRLSRSANYEPVRGIWCRVCKECYEKRPWYADTEGCSRDVYKSFDVLRNTALSKKHLEINLQHKRLAKLLQNLTTLERSQERPHLFRLLSSVNTERRELEQAFVDWQNDDAVESCPHCRATFNYLNKKHHCRLCGRVVCGNAATKCSDIIPFAPSGTSQVAAQTSIELRLCRDCEDSIFLGDTVTHGLDTPAPAYQKSYKALLQYRSSIEGLMPRFRKLLVALTDRSVVPSKADMIEAKRVRGRLLDAFAQFDAIAKKVKNAPASCETEATLQNAIYQQASRYLQLHMITLQSIPLRTSKTMDKGDEGVVNTTMEALRISEEQTELHQELAAFSEQRVSLFPFGTVPSLTSIVSTRGASSNLSENSQI